MRPVGRRNGLILCLFLWSSTLWAVPETINIQGSLSDSNGDPLVGTRAYRIQFFDSVEGGASLGAAIEGFVTPSAAGRFSIDVVPPSEAFTATEVYYSLGIDSGNPTDGSVDSQDVFPNRVKVNSVLFAREAEHAISADTAENATAAFGLSGALENPGDRISLGDNVFLQVGPDGEVELVASGRRLRLAGQNWADPRALSDNITPNGQVQTAPRLAINAKGETVIGWAQFDGMRDQIFRSHYTEGFWADPLDLDDNISPSQIASDPVVAVSDNSDAVILWRQLDGAIHKIFRSEYRNGLWTDPNGPAEFISPDGQDAGIPQIAMNANGEAVIVWEESNGAVLQIYRSEYRNGSWDDPTDLVNDSITPDSTTAAANPRVALNDNGEAVIVWEQPILGISHILRSEYRDGLWNLVDIASPDGQGASSPRVALNNNGEAVIVWTQISDLEKIEVFRSEYRNGAWTDPTDLSDNISPDGQPVMDPQVALSDNGDAVIVWTQSDGAHSQIFRSEFRNGDWDDPESLSDNISPDGAFAQTPQVHMNADGDTLIVWVQSDGANPQLFRSEYRNGVWTDPASLTDNFTPDGGAVLDFQSALNGLGEAVIAWQQFDGGRNQIFRSEYRGGDWSDPANLPDNISPSQTPSDPPQMALSDNGDTVIVWRQNDNMFFQIFRSEYRFGF